MSEQVVKVEGIRLNAEAVRAAKALQGEHLEWAQKPLRLYLEGKGCDGFFYGVSFDQRLPQDHVFPIATELDVVVDPDTYEFVRGSTITWVDDERGKGFLVENPRHDHFRGKFFKRSKWQEKLAQRR